LTKYAGVRYPPSNLVGIISASLCNYGMNANVTWELARAERNAPCRLMVKESIIDLPGSGIRGTVTVVPIPNGASAAKLLGGNHVGPT